MLVADVEVALRRRVLVGAGKLQREVADRDRAALRQAFEIPLVELIGVGADLRHQHAVAPLVEVLRLLHNRAVRRLLRLGRRLRRRLRRRRHDGGSLRPAPCHGTLRRLLLGRLDSDLRKLGLGVAWAGNERQGDRRAGERGGREQIAHCELPLDIE